MQLSFMVLWVPLYYLFGLVALTFVFVSIEIPRSDKGIVKLPFNNCSKVLL